MIAVVGPTAVGKTELAEELALRTTGEIVSADSMQVYRGMDIGTAKPSPPYRVPYHCLDLVDPGVHYSAALFQRDARAAIQDVRSRDGRPIVCGGTGLYVRAALDDWEFPEGHADTATRQRLERELDDLGAAAMHARLAELDPEAAELIHPNNSKRVVRALEMLEAGASYSQQAARFGEHREHIATVYVGLTMDRARLYERIEARVDQMLEDGLIDEVGRLLAAGYRDALTSSQAIGYKEFVAVLEDGAPLAEAIADVKQATRRYAKRQLTWFRADPRVRWLDVTESSPEERLDGAYALVSSD